jgi:hypothetical protein
MVDDKPKVDINELPESEFESERSESEEIIFVNNNGWMRKTDSGENSNKVNEEVEKITKDSNEVKKIKEELEKNKIQIDLSEFVYIAKENPERFLDCILESLKSLNDCKIRKIEWPKNFSIKGDNLINKMQKIENKLDGMSIFDKVFT